MTVGSPIAWASTTSRPRTICSSRAIRPDTSRAGTIAAAEAPSLSTFDAQGNLISTKRIFDRETVQDWELGAKTSWLDRKLTANLTFYRMDISGYQDRAFDGISFTVLNAGKLRQQGFEFDGVAKPIRGLSLFGSVAYLDFEFLDYPNAPGLPGCAPNAAGEFRRLHRCRTWGDPGPRRQAGYELAEVERPRRLRLDRRCRHERDDCTI